MGVEKRYGRQTPTTSVVLSYQDSRGTEAIDIYNRSNKGVLPWQELMLEDIMAACNIDLKNSLSTSVRLIRLG